MLVTAPVGNLMKHEIIALGLKNGAPLHLTYSCYGPGPEPCGVCKSCEHRAAAFARNGVPDPATVFVASDEAAKQEVSS
jgi:7-cyano-7-deazaguanine synthase